jgi:hypothetical protein
MKKTRLLLMTVGLWLAAMLSAAAASPEGTDLAARFLHPPEEAKPWVYWFVMDGNLRREGITADLEAMKRVGIGGLLFMEVDVGIPKGPTKFMSPPWRELFKHANQEAARLGLQITMPASPGWTGSGGPWVKAEQSMQKLVSSETNVAGPQRFHAALPPPERIAGFYRDVAVLAFPTPEKDSRIADIQEKALYHRGHFSSESGVKMFLPMPAKYPALRPEEIIPMDRIVDLTDKLDAEGRLAWDVPQGKWTIMRFGHTSTGATTRPAPEPGLGLECDKLDKAALKAHFDAFIGRIMSDIGPLTGKSLVSLHIDSWEMGPQNWTARLPAEFQHRRGYDLLRYLPVMTGRVVDSLEVSERFLWDLRQTVLELIAENHAGYLGELAHRHGMRLSIEPYDGTPCDDMTYGSRADVSMGEFWWYGFDTCFSCTEASSIAHTYGKRIVQAEAFTSNPGEDWRACPATSKPLGDWAFCDGINRFVFHRYAHQPWLDRWPGVTMGPYGIHYERTQTWWEQSRAWLAYLSRCQALLQQGLFVADVCYLTPEASPQVFRPGPDATQGFPPKRLGYNFDGCTPEALLTRMTVKNGRLTMPDGMSYRLLVLPTVPTMTPRLLGKIKELVRAGATVIGPRPLRSPSLADYPQCDDELKRLADELWGAGQPSVAMEEHSLGKGRLLSLPRPGDAAEALPSHPNPLRQAKWIWLREGNPAQAAPVGKRYFRRTINIEAGRTVRSARAVMTADNAFQLWVNGKPAGGWQNFTTARGMDIAPLLKPGTNVLAVSADNGGEGPNPAGLIGSFRIQFTDGRTVQVNTDGKWEAAETVKNDDWTTAAKAAGGWTPAMELGPLGMAPWGMVGLSIEQPRPFPDFGVIAEVLAKMHVPPDFQADQDLRYIHKRDGNADIYFVANGQPTGVEAACTFRVSGKTPEIWDAVTGEMRPASDFRQANRCTTVSLRFAPGGSLFIVFRTPTGLAQSAGRNFPELEPVAEIGGPWTVEFDPRWGGPRSVRFDELTDWTARPEEGIKYYSGRATYRKTFTLPEQQAGGQPARKTYLDLGEVKDLAEVRLNGKRLGVVWCPPWRIEITTAVRPGANDLELVVVNEWVNRLIGDARLPRSKRLTWTTWSPYQGNSPLSKSGLLGPVRLERAK